MGFVKFMLVVLFLAACISAESEESLSEELLLKPLSNGDLLAQFRFTVVAPGAGTTDHGHYHLFPRGIGELLRVHSLREFSVSLSRGVWRDKNWGFSPHSHPTGANVKAWFNKGIVRIIRHKIVFIFIFYKFIFLQM